MTERQTEPCNTHKVTIWWDIWGYNTSIKCRTEAVTHLYNMTHWTGLLKTQKSNNVKKHEMVKLRDMMI